MTILNDKHLNEPSSLGWTFAAFALLPFAFQNIFPSVGSNGNLSLDIFSNFFQWTEANRRTWVLEQPATRETWELPILFRELTDSGEKHKSEHYDVVVLCLGVQFSIQLFGM